MEEKVNKIKELIEKEYDSYACGWTEERSRGNSTDSFEDGYTCGSSWFAYQVGCILEMDLEEPEIDDECY
ncbi:hypothetical protein JY742_10330 [Clostridioides difficile]|nr:hypothetical protein [Clostridioides difficile]